MKLKTVRETPPGGWRYQILVAGIEPILVKGESWRNLVQVAKSTMVNNSIPVPATLENDIQDWICTQCPPDKCFYTPGLGDRISQVIHTAAAGVDAVLKTNLQKKARGCSSCGKRRRQLNG